VAETLSTPAAAARPPDLAVHAPPDAPLPGLGVDAAVDTEVDTPPRHPALSPSRAGDFKQCPLLYRFRVIDRLPEPPSPAQVRGTLVHAVLERLYALPAAQRVPAAARELVAAVWSDLCADDARLPGALFGDGCESPHDAEPAAWLAGAGPLLDAYFTLEDPREVEPEARELLVEAELESGLLLRGYVDRIDRIGSGSSQRIRVVDYKTGAAPRPVAELRALFQMKFYALVLLLLRGTVPVELRLMYLTGPEALSYTPDEAQLRRFARTLDAVWVAIRSAGASGDFRPNPGPMCGWCHHRALCPAWEGTPPPYPGWPGDAAADVPAELPLDRVE
jgi:putative RecB family exonuclease